MLDDLQRPPPPALADDDALFLDVDGTLLEFADHPDKVAPDPSLLALLDSVQQRLGGALALLSGRPVSQLQAMFASLRLPMAGLHGAQLLTSVDAELAETDTAAWLHTLHQRAMQLAHAHPGVMIENKGQALALHWRNAPDAGAAVVAFANAQLPELRDVRLQPGNHVIEFVGSGHDKGRALQQLMQQPLFQGRRPLFIGDDLTDEHGFRAAQQLKGIGVLVGQRNESVAVAALPDITAVHAWLRAAIT